ncbi:MAG: VWA domain-containing protein [Planctomycetota bacterium]|jgi:uncharacterized membrane protein
MYYPTFESPWWLILLVLVPFAVRLGRKSMAGLSLLRRTFSITLRTLILVLLILALAEVHFVRTSRDITVLYVWDRSRSVPPEMREGVARFISRTTEAKPYDDRWGVLVFGRVPSVESGASKESYFTGDIESDLGTEGYDFTDIGSAIRLGVAAFPPHTGKRIVLISDGNENMGDSVDAARSANENGVKIDVLPLAHTPDNDILIERLILPGEVNKERPFRIKAVVKALRRCKARVTLFRDGANIEQVEREFPAGTSLVSFRQRLSGGREALGQFYKYEVEIEPLAFDGESRNNRAYGSVLVRGKPMVAVVANDATEIVEFLRALHQSGIDAAPFTPEQFLNIFQSLEQMSQLSALVLVNVSAADINQAQENIQEAVRDAGVGLVMIGGEHSFGPGGYINTPIEKALPVDMDVKRKKVIPNGALVLIMHTCEFANGNQWAKDISIAAIKVLDPRDQVGLLFYGWNLRGVGWLFKIQPASNKTKFYGMINNQMNPGDMPDFESTFRMALTGLKNVQAGLKHTIVISDGDPSMTNWGLIKDFKKNRISISTIAIAPHGGQGDIAKMKRIADITGGKFYHVKANNLSSLPRIFIKEAVRLRKAGIIHKWTPSFFSSDPEQVTGGIGMREFPGVNAYVCTTEKSKATVVLHAQGEDKDPLLAYWQHGLGRSVAWTSDVRPKWAPSWLEWPKFQAFWSQAIRWVAKPAGEAKLQIIPTVAGGRGHIVVDASTISGKITQFEEITARVTKPSGEYEDVRLHQVGPGRFEGSFDATRKGTYQITTSYVELEKDDEGKPKKGRLTTSTDVSFSPEFLAEPPRMHLLEEIASVGGGRMLDFDTRSEEVFKHDLKGSKIPLPVWGICLLIALLLFPADVFVRRVMIDWPMIVAAWGAVVAWIFARSRKGEKATEEMSRLLAKKSELKKKEEERRKVAQYIPSKDKIRIEKPIDIEALTSRKMPERTTPAPRKSGPGKKDEAPAAKEDAFSRLLEAKKRARQERKGDEKK